MSLYQIQLYSLLRSKLNAASVNLETPDEITAGEFMDLVCAEYPLLAPYRSVMRLAVNQVYIQDSQIIQDGDEIAIITPVSGG